MSLTYQACGGVAARQVGVRGNHPVGGEGGGWSPSPPGAWGGQPPPFHLA